MPNLKNYPATAEGFGVKLYVTASNKVKPRLRNKFSRIPDEPKMHPLTVRAIIRRRIQARMQGKKYFAEGDIVRVVTNLGGPHIPEAFSGMTGLVIVVSHLADDSWDQDIGVYFHEKQDRLHDLAGHCPDNHGWWFNRINLEIIRRIEEGCDQKILQKA